MSADNRFDALDPARVAPHPPVTACEQKHPSLGKRLSWQLAGQTALGLGLLCVCLWFVILWMFDRKHQEQWETKATIVQEIVRNTAHAGEAEVLRKMAYYADRRPGTFVVLRRADGTEFYRDREPTFDVTDDDVRAGSFLIPAPGLPGGLLQGSLVMDCSEDAGPLTGLAFFLLFAALGGGAFVGVAAFWSVRRGLAPVMDLAAQTRAIDADRLGQRLHLSRPIEELQPAVDQFNALMERLERAYVQLEGFNADVAHELRTPLAALIGHTELALSRERSPETLCETMSSNLEELQRLAAMVNDMLFLASADRGAQARRGAPVSLAQLARQVVEFHEAALDDARLEVRIEGDATVAVDEPLVKRALSNLVGNATRYARPGSVLEVSIRPGDGPGQVTVEVTNAGPAIAPEALPRIFDRFFRADTARQSGEAGHHGLGLAIVAAIARMHRGQPLAASRDGVTRVGFSLSAAGAG